MKDMEIIKHVCDRCKKETTSFLKMQTERISRDLAVNIRVKGSYLLCDKCAEEFTNNFLIPISKMPPNDSGHRRSWKCPQCLSRYIFTMGPFPGYEHGHEPVRICYYDAPYMCLDTIPRDHFKSENGVAFECFTCKRSLYVPDEVIKEANKDA